MAELPPATQFQPYEQRLLFRGDREAITVEVAATNGVALGERDQITGTPSATGTFQVPVTMTQPNGNRLMAELPWTVNQPPLIDEPETISLQQGQAVQRPIKVQHGTPPYVWQLVGGTLPLGVRLDEDGYIRGSAEELGTTQARVQVTDRWGATHDWELSFQITESPEQQDQQNDERRKENEESEEKEESDESDQNNDNQDQQNDQQQSGDQNQQQQNGDQPDQGSQGDQQQLAQNDQAQNDGLSDEEAAAEQEERLSRGQALRFLDQLPDGQEADQILPFFRDPDGQAGGNEEQAW